MKKIMFFCLLALMAAMPVQANTREEVAFSKCTDGDTAHFKINGKDTTVRFLAINAPEFTKTKEPYGKEASAYVCDALQSAETIELEYDDGSDKLDKYGRTLAWVYADGVLLQKELVKQGLAEVKYIYGDYAYTKELQELEKEAKKRSCICGAMEQLLKSNKMKQYSMYWELQAVLSYLFLDCSLRRASVINSAISARESVSCVKNE